MAKRAARGLMILVVGVRRLGGGWSCVGVAVAVGAGETRQHQHVHRQQSDQSLHGRKATAGVHATGSQKQKPMREWAAIQLFFISLKTDPDMEYSFLHVGRPLLHYLIVSRNQHIPQPDHHFLCLSERFHPESESTFSP